MKSWLLDLYSCAGGAGQGYGEAGFEVFGVDKDPQPNYPADFRQADAIGILERLARSEKAWDGAPPFSAVHCSPPCQHKARVTAWRGSRESHPDLLTPTLELLRGVRLPWVVENVPEACPPLRPDYLLCGTQFGLKVRRHRAFQRGNWSAYDLLPPCVCYRNPDLLPFMHKGERAFADAMGCTWMTSEEGRQAVPPVMTAYIGGQMLACIQEAAA